MNTLLIVFTLLFSAASPAKITTESKISQQASVFDFLNDLQESVKAGDAENTAAYFYFPTSMGQFLVKSTELDSLGYDEFVTYYQEIFNVEFKSAILKTSISDLYHYPIQNDKAETDRYNLGFTLEEGTVIILQIELLPEGYKITKVDFAG